VFWPGIEVRVALRKADSDLRHCKIATVGFQHVVWKSSLKSIFCAECMLHISGLSKALHMALWQSSSGGPAVDLTAAVNRCTASDSAIAQVNLRLLTAY